MKKLITLLAIAFAACTQPQHISTKLTAAAKNPPPIQPAHVFPYSAKHKNTNPKAPSTAALKPKLGLRFATSFAFDSTQDLGAQINNYAQSFNATTSTVIDVPPGNYHINTMVVLGSNKKVHLGAGHYTSSTPAAVYSPLFQIGDNVEIYGDGVGATIVDTPPGILWVAPSSEMSYGPSDGAHNVHIHDLTINGVTPGITQDADSIIALGNSHNVHIERVYVLNTPGYGVEIGESSLAGFHPDHIWVTDCVFDGVGDQNIAIVNGINIFIRGNLFKNITTGHGAIDAEPNTQLDQVRNYIISDNIVDGRGAHISAGFEIQGGMQPGEAQTVGGVIANNVFVGDEEYVGNPTYDWQGFYQGIMVNGAQDVLIANNNFAGHFDGAAFNAYKALRMSFTGNRIQAAGFSPGYGGGMIVLQDTVSSNISFNTLYSPANMGQGDSAITEFGSSDYNTFTGNSLQQTQENYADPNFNPRIVLVGAHSHAYNNVLAGVLH